MELSSGQAPGGLNGSEVAMGRKHKEARWSRPTRPHLKHHLRSGVPSELLPTVTISPERKAFLRNTGKERSMSRMVVAHLGRESGRAAREPRPALPNCSQGRNDAENQAF